MMMPEMNKLVVPPEKKPQPQPTDPQPDRDEGTEEDPA